MSNDAVIVRKKQIPQLWAIPRPCICPKPIEIDGETFIAHSPSCEVDGHGCVSMHIPQVGHAWRDNHADTKKNTRVSGRSQ